MKLTTYIRLVPMLILNGAIYLFMYLFIYSFIYIYLSIYLFICGLFKDSIGVSGYIASNDKIVICELGRMEKVPRVTFCSAVMSWPPIGVTEDNHGQPRSR